MLVARPEPVERRLAITEGDTTSFSSSGTSHDGGVGQRTVVVCFWTTGALPTSLQFGGVAHTGVVIGQRTGHRCGVYWFQSPAGSGSANITFSGTCSGFAITLLGSAGEAGVVGGTNVSSVSGNANSGSPSVTVGGGEPPLYAPTAGDYIIDCVQTGSSPTAGANQTTLSSSHVSKQDAGDGGVMSWSQSSAAWAQAAVAFRAANERVVRRGAYGFAPSTRADY